MWLGTNRFGAAEVCSCGLWVWMRMGWSVAGAGLDLRGGRPSCRLVSERERERDHPLLKIMDT